LPNSDQPKIADYVTEQFELLGSHTDIAKLSAMTRELVGFSRSRSGVANTKKIYSDLFSAAVKSNYRSLFDKGAAVSKTAKAPAQRLAQQQKLSAVVVLVACDNVLLLDDLVTLLGDESEAIRMWAAKGLAGKNIHKALLQGQPDVTAVTKVINGLSDCLDQTSSGAVVEKIVQAGNLPKAQGCAAIMNKCAKVRLAHYRQWKVTNELSDLKIIREMLATAAGDGIFGDANLRTQVVAGAAQLYWAAYSRYAKGMTYKEGEDQNSEVLVLLMPDSQLSLETLLIEGEQAFNKMANLTGNTGTRARFLTALNERKWTTISRAFDLLIGKGGTINNSFNIYPGADGPEALPDPPKETVNRAKNLRDLNANLIETD
ncbi:MAG: hypothetical protein KAR11_05480, partial [Phycisphaerae bacterium]|nr:hypothetical protein [Phycisphaerae bacterium]